MYALRTLRPPDSLVAGYRAGDEIHESVVENWGLVLGEDVTDVRPGDETEPPAVVRPDAGANRAEWEGYAIANGMTPDDAAAASQEDLEAVEPEADRARPADSAKKPEWVDYAIARGADEEWARSEGTTKANLQAWEPEVGDPVAVEATEQANG